MPPPSPAAEPATRLEPPAGPHKARRSRPWAAGSFVLLLGLVVWGSLTPSPPSAPGGLSDKVQHFAAYAALTGLAGLAFPRRSVLIAAALLALGGGVELGQAAMALGRQGSWLDMLANSAGVGVAGLLGAARLRGGGETVRS